MDFGKEGEEKVKARMENAIKNNPKFNEITDNAEALIMWHCFLKGLQGGPVLGTIIGLPYIALTRRPFLHVYFKSLRHGTLGFTAFALGMGAYKVNSGHELYNKDRRYRLYYNQGQNKVDMLTLASGGMACGITGVFCLLTKKPKVAPAMFSAWNLGVLGGLIYFGMTK